MCSRGVARHIMQKMGFDFTNAAGLGAARQGAVTPVAVAANCRARGGRECSKNAGLGLESQGAQGAGGSSTSTKAASLVGVNRALESVGVQQHSHAPLRVVGRKTARESNEQILVVAEMLKQKQAALSKLGRDAAHHPLELQHLVDGKMKHVQCEIEDLHRAADEAQRIAQLKTASKKLKKVHVPCTRAI